MDDRDITSKWYFLKSNGFFQTTPFAGYSFIDSAKTKKEVVFWYLLLVCFTVITIYNVSGSLSRFTSRPTAVSIRMLSTTAGAAISDLTLTMTMHLFEFIKHAPLKLEYPYLTMHMTDTTGYDSAMMFFACDASDPEKPDDYLQTLLTKDIVMYWKNLLVDWLDIDFNSTLNRYSIGDERIRDVWSNNLEKSIADLYNFFMSSMSIKPTSAVIDQFYIHIYDAMFEVAQYKIAYLMTLEALKTGVDPRLKLFDELRKLFEYIPIGGAYRISDDPELGQVEKQLLNGELLEKWRTKFSRGTKGLLNSLGVSSNEIVKWALAGLNELFHIETSPKVDIFLRDWTYNITYYKDSSLFKITFNMKVPPETQELSVKIYSMLQSRFDTFYSSFLWAIHEVIDLYGHHNLMHCKDGDEIQARMLEYMVNSFLANYDDAKLLIESGKGASVLLEPFYKYNLAMKTSGHFSSKTDKCHNGTHLKCVDECIYELSIKHCNCFPWYLYYLNEDNDDTCNKPCKEADRLTPSCYDKCDQLFKHPCNLYIYDIDLLEMIQDRHKGSVEELSTLFSFILTPAARNYPSIMEEYAMPPGLLLSELGGNTTRETKQMKKILALVEKREKESQKRYYEVIEKQIHENLQEIRLLREMIEVKSKPQIRKPRSRSHK